MEETHKNRWLTISYIALIAVFFIGFIYAAYVGSRDARDPRLADNATHLQTRTDGVDIILFLGRERIVGRNKLVYHGLKNGRIHIAVYIMDLDPKVAYHHQISLKEARKGLRLGGHSFILIYAGNSTLRLKPNR